MSGQKLSKDTEGPSNVVNKVDKEAGFPKCGYTHTHIEEVGMRNSERGA